MNFKFFIETNKYWITIKLFFKLKLTLEVFLMKIWIFDAIWSNTKFCMIWKWNSTVYIWFVSWNAKEITAWLKMLVEFKMPPFSLLIVDLLSNHIITTHNNRLNCVPLMLRPDKLRLQVRNFVVLSAMMRQINNIQLNVIYVKIDRQVWLLPARDISKWLFPIWLKLLIYRDD